MYGFYSSHVGLLRYLAKELRGAASIETDNESFANLAAEAERLLLSLEDLTRAKTINSNSALV